MAELPRISPEEKIVRPDGRMAENFTRLLLLLLAKIDDLERRIAALE